MTDRSKLLALAGEVSAAKHCINTLDVRVEVALFKPDVTYASVRPNAAGTKVIYTTHNGREAIFWPKDWTLGPAMRGKTALALRAQAEALS